MAFIGTPLDTRNTFQSLAGKRFNGDGSTTAFTLDVAPSSTLDIEVFVGNVRQDPNSAYTLSGTTLTFTGAPPSGTNNIYVVHQAKSVGTIDVPASGVQAGSLASSVLTGQTDIGGAIADADLFLVDDGAGGTLRKTAASRIKTYIGDNTPMWGAYIGSDQTGLSDNTLTKGAFNTEFFDSDGAYDTSNYRFTVPSGKAGKYFITGNITFQGTSGGHGRSIYTYIYKNGSSLGKSGYFLTDNSFEGTQHNGTNVSAIYDLAVGDYIELYAQKYASGGIIKSGTAASYFGGYKLI